MCHFGNKRDRRKQTKTKTLVSGVPHFHTEMDAETCGCAPPAARPSLPLRQPWPRLRVRRSGRCFVHCSKPGGASPQMLSSSHAQRPKQTKTKMGSSQHVLKLITKLILFRLLSHVSGPVCSHVGRFRTTSSLRKGPEEANLRRLPCSPG